MTAEELLEKYRFEAGEHIGNRDYDRMCEFAKEFAKLHVLAALEAACDKSRINRKPTGEGETSDEETSTSFYGDLGYEDYIPVEYTIDVSSIQEAYPLTNIK